MEREKSRDLSLAFTENARLRLCAEGKKVPLQEVCGEQGERLLCMERRLQGSEDLRCCREESTLHSSETACHDVLLCFEVAALLKLQSNSTLLKSSKRHAPNTNSVFDVMADHVSN